MEMKSKTPSRPSYHIKTISIILLLLVIVAGNSCATPGATEQTSKPDMKSPVIRHLTAPKQVIPSKGAEILCVATDAGNSVLMYEWSATGGEIENREDPESILWIAPGKEGSYTISVVVTNADGDQATKSVSVNVTREPDQSPVIYTVKCQDCRDEMEASRFTQYILRCDASAPSGSTLHYTWFANLGKIQGEGASVTWFTGSQYGNALITVIVADDKGNESEGYLAVNVSCCN